MQHNKSKIPTLSKRSRSVKVLSSDRHSASNFLKGRDLYGEYVDVLDAYMNQDILVERQNANKVASQILTAKGRLDDIRLERLEYVKKKRALIASLKEAQGIESKLRGILKAQNLICKRQESDKRKELHIKKVELNKSINNNLKSVEVDCHNVIESSLRDDDIEHSRVEKLEDIGKKIDILISEVDQKKSLKDLQLSRLTKQLELEEMKDISSDNRLQIKKNELDTKFNYKNDIQHQIQAQNSNLKSIILSIRELENRIKELKPYSGSINVTISELTNRKLQLKILLNNIHHEIDLLKKIDMPKELKQFNQAKSKDDLIRYDNLQLRNSVRKYTGELCVYIISDSVFNCSDQSNIVNSSYNFSNLLDIYLKDCINGVSFAVIQMGIQLPCIWDHTRQWLAKHPLISSTPFNDDQLNQFEATINKGFSLTTGSSVAPKHSMVVFINTENLLHLSSICTRMRVIFIVAKDSKILEKLQTLRCASQLASYHLCNK